MPSAGGASRRHALAVVTLIGCALLWSTAGVVTRNLDFAGGFELTFWRSLACIVFVVGYLVATRGGRWLSVITATGWAGLVSGVMWAVMFTCFMIALTLTTVAKALVVMAIAPLLTALLAWIVLGEQVPRRTWFAIVVAGGGIVWMVHDSLGGDGGRSSPWGMLIAACVPLASAINLVNLKRQQARVDMVPAVLIGALISCIVTLPFMFPMQASGRDIALLSALGVFQLAVPCILMIHAARHLSPQETSLLSLLEVVFGPLWAWLGVGERPANATLWGGGLILAALVANAALAPRRAREAAAVAGAGPLVPVDAAKPAPVSARR